MGAYYVVNALSNYQIKNAYFISPIVDMLKLIEDMMLWSIVSKKELEEKKEIHIDFGETLSWPYYVYTKEHPIVWHVPTSIAYGENDNLTSLETMKEFCNQTNAKMSIMKDGEDWFHTEKQMLFLTDFFRIINKKITIFIKYL